MRKLIVILLFFKGSTTCFSQIDSLKRIENEIIDSLYIVEVQDKVEPDKVLHAEPLFIDLIRDLGARKGEKEWNLGFGITDNLDFDVYEMLVEYEFAPVDRLGLEIEVPVTIFARQKNGQSDRTPPDRIESLKVAGQWSFLVSQKYKTTLALGYINEFEFSDLKNFGSPLFTGNIYNPFFIMAKRLSSNWHSLIYTGPKIHQDFESKAWKSIYEINSNIHYMIPGTRNFLGLEANKAFNGSDFDMVLRPQMRVGVADNFLIGIVSGIPIERENQRMSMFFRLIWEPGHKR